MTDDFRAGRPSIKLLCTGDVHIGRRPTHLPEGTGPELASADGWRQVCRTALDERVDAVLLSGDIVDRDNRYFEAFGPLEAGIRSLAQAGIPVVAVAGNHDFDVLPRLAESFPSDQFRLLGRGGRWERIALPNARNPQLYIDGWSLPAEHYPDDPLAGFTAQGSGGLPLIGLLHADLDQHGSRYAPVTSAALRAQPHQLWLLGHVHAPALHREPGRSDLLYPGSPIALSPKETGSHGPWLVEIGAEGSLTVRRLPLSPVRYESIAVDLDGVEDEAELQRRLAHAVREALGRAVAESSALRILVCRLRLVGRTPLHRTIAGRTGRFVADLEPREGEAVAVIDDLSVDTRPAYDLDEIAAGSGPPAALARLLLALRSDAESPAAIRLLQEAERELAVVQSAPAYRNLADRSATDEDGAGPDAADPPLTAVIERQGLLLLDALLAQTEAAS